MNSFVSIVAALVIGVVATVPFTFAKQNESMAWGFGAIICSFVLITVLLLVLKASGSSALVASGTLSILVLLAGVILIFIIPHGS